MDIMVDQATTVVDLLATKFPAEFTSGARNAVTTCLKIQPTEKVTLITDERCLTIAASLAAELDRIGCKWNAFVLESLAPRPLTEMPTPVLADMETSQVSIFAVEVQPNELHSRMQMTDVVNRRRMRHAHMVNITPEIMCDGMRARSRQAGRHREVIESSYQDRRRTNLTTNPKIDEL